MPIRSAGITNDPIDWAGLARKKYDLKERQAMAAKMRAGAAMLEARTGATTAKRRFGPGGLQQQSLDLTREELARRFPYQAPQYNAETQRISALAAKRRAGATSVWSNAIAKRNLGELELEQKNQALPGASGVAVPSTEAIVNELSKKLKKKTNPGMGTNATDTTAATPSSSPLLLTDWLEKILGY